MSRPRLLYYSLLSYRPENRRRLQEAFDLVERDSPLEDSDEVLAGLDACCAPLGYPFDAAKMDRCPRLRAILSNTTGVPHIDMEEAARRGIAVFSLKDEQAFLDTITPTAEHAWGLMLALLRRTPWCFADVAQGRWNRFDWGAERMLSRMSLGLIGYGRLGRRMARYARAFDMPVRFHDPHVAGDGAAEKVAHLEELVSSVDIVSLHAPALPETANLVSAEVIAAFRPGAWFVNTARAELVDEQALLAALRSGAIAGYAADVLDGEFAPGFDAGSHPLVVHARTHDNVLLTPHIGGSTIDAWRETQARVIEMAIRHFGEPGA